MVVPWVIVLVCVARVVSGEVAALGSVNLNTSAADEPLPLCRPRPCPPLNATTTLSKNWKKVKETLFSNPVRFKFHQEFSKRKHKAMIFKAMNIIEEVTCLRFLNVTGKENAEGKECVMNIRNQKPACFAALGCDKKNRIRVVNLPVGCLTPSVSGVVHEFIHSFGFHHMHTRFDRDDYIDVQLGNVRKRNHLNFKKCKGNTCEIKMIGLPYDYNSIMHYADYSFSKGCNPAMTPTKPHSGKVGFVKHLSRTDVAAINRLYECWDHYLGDDIPGATPYCEWRQQYVTA